jgi:hypothetical protein
MGSGKAFDTEQIAKIGDKCRYGRDIRVLRKAKPSRTGLARGLERHSLGGTSVLFKCQPPAKKGRSEDSQFGHFRSLIAVDAAMIWAEVF